MVELSTRKREIRGDGGNHHEKLGLKRILCVSQLTIPDTAGTSPDPAVITPRRGLLNPIWQVVPLISHSRSYPPYCSHIHHPSLCSSGKNISVRAEWLRQSGRTQSEPSETPRWRITQRPASIPRVALHIAVRSQFRRFSLRLCKSILRCSWKHLQLWRCIQDATRFDY